MSSVGRHADVVVAGGGFAGLSLGMALSRAGLQVRVIEATVGMGKTFRGELLHPPGVRALEAIGLGEAMWSTGAVAVKGFAAFRSPPAEPVRLPYAPEAGPGAGFDHGKLLMAFRRELGEHRAVQVSSPVRAETLMFEAGRVVGVRDADGGEHRAPIVIIADGRHSKLRAQLGVGVTSTLLSYTIAPGWEDPQGLPLPEYGHIFVGGPGPVLAYPYGQGRVRMCIDIPLGVTTGRASLATYVRHHFASLVPARLATGMVAAIERGHFGSSANHAICTEQCAVPGAALLGDAGGCAHPLSAGGMTAALHDVTTLVDCLRVHGLTDEALLVYQRRRYRFVRAREVFAHALYEILRGAGAGPRALREGVFRYWERDARSRQRSMQILSGDDSTVASFVTEYARVVGLSSWQTSRSLLRDRAAFGVARPLAALLWTAGGCMDVARAKLMSTLWLDQQRSLTPAPAAVSTTVPTAVPRRRLSLAVVARKTTLRRMRGWLDPHAP